MRATDAYIIECQGVLGIVVDSAARISHAVINFQWFPVPSLYFVSMFVFVILASFPLISRRLQIRIYIGIARSRKPKNARIYLQGPWTVFYCNPT